MSFTFRPPTSGESPIFAMIAGGTNTGKSWSALRLLRGMVGSEGRIAALDTESGRLTNLRKHHRFEINIMEPPFRPTRFAEAAEIAQHQGFDGLLIDSMSMMQTGPGGYRDWHMEETERLAGGDPEKFEKHKWRARMKPSLDRQAMLYRMLQLRIPVVFSVRAREMTEMKGNEVKKIGWQPVIHPEFLYDMTVALTLRPEDGKGKINTAAPFKIEKDLIPVFRNGEEITEEHGRRVMEIMRASEEPGKRKFWLQRPDGKWHDVPTIEAWGEWWDTFIGREQPSMVAAARRAHATLIAEYAQDFPDQIRALEAKLDEAVKWGGAHGPGSNERR